MSLYQLKKRFKRYENFLFYPAAKIRQSDRQFLFYYLFYLKENFDGVFLKIQIQIIIHSYSNLNLNSNKQ